MTNIVNPTLFWAHLSFIAGAMFVGLIFPLYVVIALIAIHRLHVHLLNGCFLTTIKQKLHAMPSNMDFIQHVSHKLFNKSLNIRQSKAIDYSIVIMTLLIALVYQN